MNLYICTLLTPLMFSLHQSLTELNNQNIHRDGMLGIDEAFNFASHLCVDKSLTGRAVWCTDRFGLTVWVCGEEHILVVATADAIGRDGDDVIPSSTPSNTSVPSCTVVDTVNMMIAAHGTAQAALEQINAHMAFETNEELG